MGEFIIAEKYAPISLAPSYVARGFSPLPLCAKGIPGYCGVPMTGWTRYCRIQAMTLEFTRWATMDPAAGLALACGFGGLVAIDVDHADGYPAAGEIFGQFKAPTKIGSKGGTAFFQDNGQCLPSRAYRRKKNPDGTPGEVLIEILATGRCTTIPPTKHRKTGLPYHWHNASLEDLRCDQLPLITAEMIAQLELALAPLMDPKREPKPLTATIKQANLGALDHKRYAAYANRALDSELAKCNAAKKGSRGRQLFESICTLGKYVHNGILDKMIVSDALVRAAIGNGLCAAVNTVDVMRTIQEGLRYSASDSLPELKDRPRMFCHGRKTHGS
jgi:hypothetical protein